MLVYLAVAWVAAPVAIQVWLSMQIRESSHRRAHLYEGFLSDLAFTWPQAMLITLLYPLLVEHLLFGGINGN